MMRTVSIIGNRPQLIKLIPELGDVVLWTGQHYSDSLRGAYTKQLERCGEVINLGETEMEKMMWAVSEALGTKGFMERMISLWTALPPPLPRATTRVYPTFFLRVVPAS